MVWFRLLFPFFLFINLVLLFSLLLLSLHPNFVCLNYLLVLIFLLVSLVHHSLIIFALITQHHNLFQPKIKSRAWWLLFSSIKIFLFQFSLSLSISFNFRPFQRYNCGLVLLMHNLIYMYSKLFETLRVVWILSDRLPAFSCSIIHTI